MDEATLVTGVTGLIGSAVALRLHRMGRTVIGADRVSTGHEPYPVATHDLPDAHRWHDIFGCFRITHVVHAGGISGPMICRDMPHKICQINLGSLIDMLEAARIHGIRRIVWFSSIAAYGVRGDLAPVAETSALVPDTVYGATKAAGEMLLNAWSEEHGLDAVSLRVASCYGPGRMTPNLIHQLVDDSFTGRATPVRSDPALHWQYVYVDDVADAACAALDRESLSARVYNIAPGRLYAAEDITRELSALLPAAHLVADEDGPTWGAYRLGPLSIELARRDLDFAPRTSLAEGARQTCLWMNERRRH